MKGKRGRFLIKKRGKIVTFVQLKNIWKIKKNSRVRTPITEEK